jgi:TMEM175 potassium channel family protein
MDALAQQDRARDFDRFLTFIDAIVAIAVTLLVLPLVDLVGELDDGDSVRRLIGDNLAPIGAFFLSFVVIANFWLIQHRMLRNVVAATENLTRVLLVWSLTVVVLPFPTALVAAPGDAGNQATTKLLYVGTMALGSWALALAALVITRHPELRDSPEEPHVAGAFGTAGTLVLALVIMLLIPAASYWPLLLLLLSDRLVSVVRRVGRASRDR